MGMGKIEWVKIIIRMHKVKRMGKICQVLEFRAERGGYPMCAGNEMAACRSVRTRRGMDARYFVSAGNSMYAGFFICCIGRGIALVVSGRYDFDICRQR